MAADLLGLLARANLAGSAAILVILAIRTPIAQRFGARVAYALWAIAPLAAAASLLPGRTVVVTAPKGLADAAPEAPARAADVVTAAVAQAPPSLDPATLLAPIWLAGASLCLALLVWRQLSLGRALGRLTPEAGLYRAEAAGIGPLVVGALRPRIVLPADFEARFDEAERAVVLEHERTHLISGDPLINAALALVQCLCWFNPLVHLAAFHVRLDQELACDARVVARHPLARRSYAEALLKTQLSPTAVPLGCAWPARSEHPLKARIAMLRTAPASAGRRVAGLALAATIGAAVAAAAWAAQPPNEEVRVAAAKDGVTAVATADKASLDKIAEVRRRAAPPRRALTEIPTEDVNRYIPGDGTPLIIAARHSDVVATRDLLARGADPNKAAPGDGNPLIVASAAGHKIVAGMLLAAGADIDGFVLGDETPLIAAARSQNPSMVRFLVERGADVNKKVPTGNWPGETRSPLSVARDPQIIEYLRAHGATS